MGFESQVGENRLPLCGLDEVAALHFPPVISGQAQKYLIAVLGHLCGRGEYGRFGQGRDPSGPEVVLEGGRPAARGASLVNLQW